MGPPTRMVTVNTTANSSFVRDGNNNILTFDSKDCPKLNTDALLWIGMHDVNKNGDYKWASGNALPIPLQWYNDQPANPGKFHA